METSKRKDYEREMVELVADLNEAQTAALLALLKTMFPANPPQAIDVTAPATPADANLI